MLIVTILKLFNLSDKYLLKKKPNEYNIIKLFKNSKIFNSLYKELNKIHNVTMI